MHRKLRSVSVFTHKGPRDKDGFRLFLLTLPFLIAIFIFSYVPLYGWIYAFFDYKPGVEFSKLNFVGFKWFLIPFKNAVLRDQFVRVMKNTLGINFLFILSMILPMLYAVLLVEIPFRTYRKAVQTLTTIPNFISWVLVYSAFFALLSTEGLLNNLLISWGIISTPSNYLANTSNMWLKMLGYNLWKGLGWGAIVYISAIAGIDQEIYEAASIDGAGRFSMMWHITIPHLIPTFFVLLILQIGNIINNGIDQFYVFSNAMTKEHIEVLDLYVYNNGLKQGNISYATAIGMWKSIISITLVFSANVLSKKVRGTQIF
ncbi:MAG: ABC transporter permease subunit [Christensenellales bacterium]|jgi:putative aldouronate transport system permease protein